jgi:CRP/FNR family cyclic AMP-dependent transcriptional regulator
MTERAARDYKKLLQAGTWFRSLDEDFQDGLVLAATLRRYQPEQRVFTRGDPCWGLGGTLEGSIRVGGTTEGGDESILVFAEPPTWFGEISIVDGGPMTHDAAAERESTVVHVAPAAVEALLLAQPERWRDMARLLATKARLLFAAMEEQALLPAASILVRRLLQMTEGYGGWDDRSARVLEINQEKLAAMLAISRQTVNQLLKELEQQRLLRPCYGGIEILDLPGLRRAARRSLVP